MKLLWQIHSMGILMEGDQRQGEAEDTGKATESLRGVDGIGSQATVEELVLRRNQTSCPLKQDRI